MRKFVLTVLVFAFGVAMLGAIFLFGFAPAFPANLSSFCHLEKGLRQMRERPRGKPLLVLVGGSNVYYGIEDGLMDAAFSNRFEVVNLGFHAGLGLGRMLEDVADGVRAGDIVCLMPEYSHWTGDSWFGGAAALVYEIDYLKRPQTLFLPRRYAGLPRMGWTMYFRSKLRALSDQGEAIGVGLKDLSRVPCKPSPKFVSERVTPLDLHALNDVALDRLSRFLSDMKSRGVRILFSAPAVDARAFEGALEDVVALYRRLASMGCEVVSSPADTAYPPEQLFDTTYHLNSIGRTNRTARLVRDLADIGL